ncbi:hypothetical protein [Oribacterium sinus]|uniref:Glycosyltransferase RgtA/B/C/D-like domain-containing protein n=1 Tax=Oribacterium sinus F0268 TaxID=585501 RepID=C2KXA6_9FIRM|nr:hypothetical protein [Oribacterium sinus]EEJ51586.1 hypothetical protein HMPREF6123_1125 [Oribacterium sinus F0268]
MKQEGNKAFIKGIPLGGYLLAFLLLLGAAYWINRQIHIKALYMDDLYLFSFFREQNFFEFSFPIGQAVRFRPVYWAISYIEMALVGADPNRYLHFNIFLNSLLAFFLFFFSLKMTKKRILSLSLGLLFLSAHFAYYQIGQAIGILETLALGFALLTLYFLYRQIDCEERAFGKMLLFSHLFFFLLIFTHERYVALLPLFYIPLFFRGKQTEVNTAARVQNIGLKEAEESENAKALDGAKAADYAKASESALSEIATAGKQYIVVEQGESESTSVNTGASTSAYTNASASASASAGKQDKLESQARKRPKLLPFFLPFVQAFLFFSIRSLAIGSFVPKGTGGTEVQDGFSLTKALSHAFSQVFYIFGIQAGPDYLAGIPWEEVGRKHRYVIYASIAVLAFSILLALVFAIRKGKLKKEFFGKNILFLCFIALCIGCSSITIRVEMRWVYVSFAAALLYFAYLLGNTGMPIPTFFALLFVCLRFPAEMKYRESFPRIYFWEDQERMNSLAEQTIGKYGRDYVLGKQVYILENNYKMSKFYGDTFFQVFDPEMSGQGTKIHFIKDFRELPSEANLYNSLVLKEVPEERAYRDITQEVFPNL